MHKSFGVLIILLVMISVSACVQAQPRRVVLLGASVGEAWDFSHLPQRLRNTAYVFEYVGLYDFDKTAALTPLLKRTAKKPDAIILKECAAYFPGDLGAYQAQVKKWVAACRAARVKPILTTVCPVTQRGDQLTSVLGYNDWIRAWARKEGVPVLDLEAALRRSSTDRRLDPTCADSDGLHVVSAGYRRLDRIVFPVLDAACR